jgi:cyclase
MSNIRFIARLDIKNNNLIKGINFEGLRIIGDPSKYAKKYYNQGADEIVLMDCVASLYGRNNLTHIIKAIAKDIFIPITVGGGIRSIEDAINIFNSGADKVAINSAAVKNPGLIKKIINRFGSQSLMLSVEAKYISYDKWEVYINYGREKTGLDVIDWVKKIINLGVGEILLTSIDQEGTEKGFDINLVKSVSKICSVPLIISGGMGKNQDLVNVINSSNIDAVAIASILHYEKTTIKKIKNFFLK